MTSRLGSIFFGVLLLWGCASGPKHRIDEALLADVPVGEKQAMLAAKSEIDAAAEEKRKAEADLQAIERDLSVAQSEYGQAKLEVDKVEADVKLAEQSKDMNRLQAAKQQLQRAKAQRDVADAKVDWQKKRRKAQQANVEVAELHRNTASARYEQEKARLAQQKGKSPGKDFSVLQFDQQAAAFQARYDQGRIDANKALQEAAQREMKYNQKRAQFDQTYGSGAAAPGQPPGGYPPAGPPGGPPGFQPPYGAPQPYGAPSQGSP